MGTKNGNLNRLVHGRDSAQLRGLADGEAKDFRLIIGKLPDAFERVVRGARKYRRDLEALWREQHQQKKINATTAHLISEAVSNELHAGICRWLLRTKLDKMDVGDVVMCSREISRAASARNKAIAQLGLDAPVDPFASLYESINAVPTSPSDEQESAGGQDDGLSTNQPEDASDAIVGDQGGEQL